MVLEIPAGIYALDLTFSHWIQSFGTQALDNIVFALTFLGNPIPWILLAAFLYWKGEEIEAFFLVNLLLFSGAVVAGMKSFVGRPRPFEMGIRILEIEPYSSLSFPSGHATLAASISSFYQSLMKHYTGFLIVFALIVSFSRVYLGVHYLSDILTGLFIGLIIGKVNYGFRNLLYKKNFTLTRFRGGIALSLLLVMLVIAFIYLQPIELVATLLGFYIGFFLLKEVGIKQKKLKLRSKRNAWKQSIGFFVLAVILFLEFLPFEAIGEISAAKRFGLFLLGGLWISFIWPYLTERKQGERFKTFHSTQLITRK